MNADLNASRQLVSALQGQSQEELQGHYEHLPISQENADRLRNCEEVLRAYERRDAWNTNAMPATIGLIVQRLNLAQDQLKRTQAENCELRTKEKEYLAEIESLMSAVFMLQKEIGPVPSANDEPKPQKVPVMTNAYQGIGSVHNNFNFNQPTLPMTMAYRPGHQLQIALKRSYDTSSH
jgi:hypothetical protein